MTGGASAPATAEILIDGAWAAARTGAACPIVNPATLKPIGAVANCGAEELAAATAAARRALAGWRRSAPGERAGLLEQAAQELERRAPALGVLQARETGQVYCESFDAVHAAAAHFRRVAQRLASSAPGVAGSEGAETAGMLGVTDGPDRALADWAGCVARLLAAGSSIVCLPSAVSPLTTLAASACLDALPPGVYNVLTTDDPAAWLRTQRESFDAVAVAGSASDTDEAPGRVPADTSCIVVSGRADLELAAAGTASLRLFHNGQRPRHGVRIYVEQPLADAFVDRLHEHVAFLEVGDPCKPGTDIGPLRSLARLTQVEETVGRALRQRATLKLGGRRYQPWGLPGYFFQPTILIDRTAGGIDEVDAVAGPVLLVTPVNDLATVVRRGCRRGARLRVALFASDPAGAQHSLAAAEPTAYCTVRVAGAGAQPEVLTQAEEGAPGIVIEAFTQPQPDWFPYHRRKLAVPPG